MLPIVQSDPIGWLDQVEVTVYGRELAWQLYVVVYGGMGTIRFQN